ncbi:MAG: transporter, partial [Verrucomicrobiae bacterium]|nr:transporter [Verrucomicrobiae bacterium]
MSELFGQLRNLSPVAHDVLLISLAVITGIGLGSIRLLGLRLGTAGVMFSGLVFAHFGLRPEGEVAHFLKDFGLVLFVFALGVQIGPGFFSSLKRQGLRLNLYAAALVLLGGLVTWLGGRFMHLPGPAMVGVFSGATTNTPS